MPIRGSTSQALPRADLMACVKERPLPFTPIYMTVFGRIDVPKNKGSFGTMPNSNWFENPTLINRAQGGAYNRIDGRTSEKSYVCYDNGLTAAYDDNARSNYEDQFQYEASIIEMLRRQVLTYREAIAATALFNTTNWPLSGNTGKNVTNEWNTASGIPVDDAAWALGKLRDNGGDPSTAVMVCSWGNFMALLNNAQLVGNSKYTQLPNQLVNDANRASIAAKLGVRDIIVGSVIKNTATEGATVSLSGVWSDEYAWFGNIAQTSAPDEFCVGRTYVNTADGGDEVAEQYRFEDARSDIYRFRGTTGTQVNYTACGILLGNVHT